MTKFDMHLSAYAIAPETIRRVEALGFRRDEFCNNSRCDATVYHGTYRGRQQLPDDDLWQVLTELLQADTTFVGGLEEEEFEPSETVVLDGQSQDFPPLRSRLGAAVPGAGVYKSCDIHININMRKSTPAAIGSIDALQLASFDKPQNDGAHRVFSATCCTMDAGRILFRELSAYLRSIPGLVGKMKIERTSRLLRFPATAPVLPLTTDSHLSLWLET